MYLRRRLIAAIFVAGVLTAGCSSSAGTSATTTALASSSATSPTSAAPTTAAPTTTAPTTAAPPTTTGPTTTVPPTAVTVAHRALTVKELLALKRPLVLSHGGGEGQYPHSTLFADGESVKAGVDILDLDVQLTKDGTLIVQHDDTVERQTESTAKVAELTFEQVNALDNAYWFTADCVCKDKPASAYLYRGIRTGAKPTPAGYTPGDFAIPRFSDLVKRFPEMPLNIEIKGTGAAAFPAAAVLAKELADLGRLDAAIVTSFDDTVVDEFRRIAPTVELTPGLGASSNWILKREPLPHGMRILQLPPEFQTIHVLTNDNVAASVAAGYPIWVWPNDRSLENTPSYLAFLKQGITGLDANFPAQAIAAVQAFMNGG